MPSRLALKALVAIMTRQGLQSVREMREAEFVAKIGELIVELAIDLLHQHPDGLHYSELTAKIAEKDPSLNLNTIRGNIWNLDHRHPKTVYKPSKGLFRLVEFQGKETEQLTESLVEEQLPKKFPGGLLRTVLRLAGQRNRGLHEGHSPWR
jgi:hypothetical protein